MGPAGPCTDPKEVAHFPPKRQEASRIQVGKWLLSEVGKQLMHAELALHSTVAQATAHSLECCAVLCCACTVLGYTWVQATNTYQLGLLHWPCPWLASLCPFVIYQHQQFPVSSQESLGSMALQTLYCSRVVGRPQGPRKSCVPQEAMGDLWVGPSFAPATKYISILIQDPAGRQPGLPWHGVIRLNQGKGNDSGPGETLQVGGGRRERGLC